MKKLLKGTVASFLFCCCCCCVRRGLGGVIRDWSIVIRDNIIVSAEPVYKYLIILPNKLPYCAIHGGKLQPWKKREQRST